MDALLDAQGIVDRMPLVPDWALEDGRLHRELTFGNFSEAFGFMARSALVAERLGHHPDWSNSWNRVTVDIASHQAGGITERCFDLARAMDAIVQD